MTRPHGPRSGERHVPGRPDPRRPATERPGPERPACVSVHVWTVPTRAVGAALGRMALDRVRLTRTPGARFAKLLGTGDGRTFTVRDADLRRWALLVAWSSTEAADAFAGSAVLRDWDRSAEHRTVLRLAPLTSRGRWSGREPFGPSDPAAARAHTGPVASITRARLRMHRAPSFWRAVPPVSSDLNTVPGLRYATGIGEAPVGLQGTLSVWDSTQALTGFAHRRRPHLDVMNRTPEENWYVEELFARFAVLSAEGLDPA
ncbi:monooxygenase [Kineococcus gynurae]|uniref:Monooxygenase n=1 Tax=Kineococcus gynurae TaxID=452979 RepID=A0ABV5LUD4_9ACTN